MHCFSRAVCLAGTSLGEVGQGSGHPSQLMRHLWHSDHLRARGGLLSLRLSSLLKWCNDEFEGHWLSVPCVRLAYTRPLCDRLQVC